MSVGLSRLISFRVGVGMDEVETSRSGAPSWAASAPPASASGKPRPVATHTYGPPGTKVAFEMDAAVAKRSAPDSRMTSGRLTTAARASTMRALAIQPFVLGMARAVRIRWARRAVAWPSNAGLAEAASAATPVTWGAAIDVPDSRRYGGEAPGNRLRMSSPGATMSTDAGP